MALVRPTLAVAVAATEATEAAAMVLVKEGST